LKNSKSQTAHSQGKTPTGKLSTWYGAMDDLEWYGPGQVTTKDGKLSILTENVAWVAVSEWDIVVSGILRLV
jgi:hypothetical protein